MTGLGWKVDQTKPTALYHLFGADNEILYIGIGFVPELRWRAHAKTAWWPLVHRKEVTWFPDRPSARAVELRLIREIQPPYNIAETSRMDAMRTNAPDVRATSGQAQRIAPELPRKKHSSNGDTRERIIALVVRQRAVDQSIDQLIIQARNQERPVEYAELEEITGLSREWLRRIANGTAPAKRPRRRTTKPEG